MSEANNVFWGSFYMCTHMENMFTKAGKKCNSTLQNMPLYFWSCVLWQVLCGCLLGEFYSEMEENWGRGAESESG